MKQLLLLMRPTVVLVLALISTVGCGHSEGDMRLKIREVESLNKQLDAEEARNKKFQKDLDDAHAKVDQLKEQLSSMGVDVATAKKDLAEQARALSEYKRRAVQLETIKSRFSQLREKLKPLEELGLRVAIRNDKIVIHLPGDVLFDSGRETLTKGGGKLLLKVAVVIRNDTALSKRDLQVAGHTDNKPYRLGVFKDNWGLSVMRAREVLAFLVDEDEGGLNPKHLSAGGYGDSDPLTKNNTPEGRQENRRVELVVLPAPEEMISLESLSSHDDD